MTEVTSNLQIIGVTPQKITISYTEAHSFNGEIKLGCYVLIPDQLSSTKSIIGMVENYHIQYDEKNENPRFLIDVKIAGVLEDNKFSRGGHGITIPPANNVTIAQKENLEYIYDIENNKKFCFSKLSQDQEILVNIDGNKFFNKHFAIVGSTGSGKSNTVAKILQKAIEEKSGTFSLNNSHVILFDIHGEYKECFGDKANNIDIDNLKLPYWLLSSEELEDFLIDSEANDHNQRNILKEFVVFSKKDKSTLSQPEKDKIHYDTPCFFNLQEVYNKIKQKDEEMVPGSGAAGVKQGPLFGKLTNFVSRLENKINDKRLDFLLGEPSKTISFNDTIKQFIGYKDNKNITVIDLSGVPSEILSIVVSLISRLLFQYGYYHKKMLENQTPKKSIEIPLLLVFEEAHKYIPKSGGVKYRAARESIERIAKEGRKYGVSLGIISQRPSEISETIFSQCNNFISMRLTNPDDQNYVKRLLPDSLGDIVDLLPILETGEALIIGDSIAMPSLVKIDKCVIEPKSNDVPYIEIWKEEWKNIDFDGLETIWKS